MTEDGSAKPGGGTLTVFEPPSGPGVRVDTYGYAGYRTNPELRLAARQGDRQGADLRRGAGAGRAGAGVVPAGRRAVEHRLPARAARRQGRARGQGAHALRRRACEEADRRGREAGRRAIFPGGGDAVARRPAGWRAGRCGRSAGGAVVRQGGGATGCAGRVQRCPRRHGAGARADAGHHRQPVGEGGRCRRGRPAAADHGRHEDAARDQEPGARLRPAHRRRGGRDGLRRPCAAVRRGGRCRGEGRRRRGEDRPRLHPARSRRVFRAPRDDARRQAARVGRRGGARPTSARRGRISTTWSIPARSSNTAPSRSPASARAARSRT